MQSFVQQYLPSLMSVECLLHLLFDPLVLGSLHHWPLNASGKVWFARAELDQMTIE